LSYSKDNDFSAYTTVLAAMAYYAAIYLDPSIFAGGDGSDGLEMSRLVTAGASAVPQSYYNSPSSMMITAAATPESSV